MAQKTRIITVVNKYWECDPVCWVLTNKYITDNSDGRIDLNIANTMKLITYPSYGAVKPATAKDSVPRIVFETDTKVIEIWCISDLLSNSSQDDQSSSEAKMNLIPVIFAYQYKNMQYDIELVIAVGTASGGPGLAVNPAFQSDNINGSVVIGSNVFMHNGWDSDSKSNYQCNCWSQILPSGSTAFIDTLNPADLNQYDTLLLCPPTNPSPENQQFYINNGYVALGDVNVTDYTKYTAKDMETGDDFITHYPDNVNGVSLETTHCLIYLSAKNYLQQNPPFIFISGVVDRYTKFSQDVNPKVYAQNVSGAHNAGVAVAYIISKLMK
ncbi:MAG: hypothetical protein H6Q17_332 [Bacteroidetes bacterium]|nr:hypothetical protein [Bacteroidota bacterium]